MVKKGDYVLIHYTGYFEDGEVFDSSRDTKPFEFQAGSGMVVPGFDNAVMGMEVNDKKEVTIPPENGYGEYNDSLKHEVPTVDIKQSFEPQVGMQIAVQMQNGSQVPAEIIEVTEDIVTLDLNHPLAGKTLKFDLELIEINDSPKYSQDCSSCSTDGCSDGSCGC